MTIEQARAWVLAECLAQTKRVEAEEPPAKWRKWDCDRYADRLEHGPEYKPSVWYGDVSNADRQQLLRGVESLEKDGLAVRGRCWGKKFTHLRLTDSGRAAAEALPTQNA